MSKYVVPCVDIVYEPLGQIAAHPRLVHVSQGTYHIHDKQDPRHEQRFPTTVKCAHFSIASQFESDDMIAVSACLRKRIGNWGTHRRHSAHDTGTRPGLRRCLGGGGSLLPEGEPDPCTSMGRTVYTADSAQKEEGANLFSAPPKDT